MAATTTNITPPTQGLAPKTLSLTNTAVTNPAPIPAGTKTVPQASTPPLDLKASDGTQLSAADDQEANVTEESGVSGQQAVNGAVTGLGAAKISQLDSLSSAQIDIPS